jgi:hypothetical protein
VSHPVEGTTEIDLSPERRPRHAAQETHQMPSAAADRHDPGAIGRRQDRTDAVAAEDGKLRHGRCDADGQIGLPPADSPEIQAAGPIDQDRHVEIALLGSITDMRFAGPCQDRPVHTPNVVTGLVRSCLSGLDAVAEHQRWMTTVPATEDLLAHRELDAA